MRPASRWRRATFAAVFLSAVGFPAFPLAARAAAESVTGTVTVAAAANLQFVLPELNAAFTRAHPNFNVETALAATGSLVAQIHHGAPYDVLLAADVDYPRALITSGDAEPESLVIYAHGTLVLWPAPPDADWAAILASASVRRIAIANPDLAPYGRAARTVLQTAGLWEALQPKIVTGDNIAQTLQFVSTGNANYGFIAGSLHHSLVARGQTPGLVLNVPGDTLAQAAVLLRHAKTSPAASAYLRWLMSPTAQTLLRENGYATEVAPPIPALP